MIGRYSYISMTTVLSNGKLDLNDTDVRVFLDGGSLMQVAMNITKYWWRCGLQLIYSLFKVVIEYVIQMMTLRWAMDTTKSVVDTR